MRVSVAANAMVEAGQWPLLKDVIAAVGGNKVACGNAYKEWVAECVQILRHYSSRNGPANQFESEKLRAQLDEARRSIEMLTNKISDVTQSNATHLERLENFLYRNVADTRQFDNRAQENEIRKMKARNEELSLENKRLQLRVNQYRELMREMRVEDPF